MKITLESLVNFFNFIFSRRRTKIGYALFVLFILLLEVFVPPLNSLKITYRLYIFLLLSISGFIFWLFLSGRFYLPSNKKIIIGIALKSFNPNAQAVINKTLMRLVDQLKALNLLDQIKIVEIGIDAFSNNQEAEKFIVKKKLNLVIHGTVYDGKCDGKYRYDLNKFFFTYFVPSVQKESPLFKTIESDINLICLHRDWNIEESNDIIDIGRVANSLFEIVLSIIAIALCHSVKHINLSIQLIEQLLPILESQIKPEEKIINISKEDGKTRVPLKILKSGRLRAILHGSYFAMTDILIFEKKYTEAISVINKGLNAGADKYDSYASLAVISYFNEGIDKAIEYTNKMDIARKNTITVDLNRAFFSIKQKQYPEAVKYYELARGKYRKENQYIIERVIFFLSERLKENKDELAYEYAIGILIHNCFDKKIGKDKLLIFIEHVGTNETYACMIEIAKRVTKMDKK